MKKLIILIFLIFLSSVSYAADSVDIFGGYTGLQATTTYSVTGENAESVTGLILTDTGAFTGKDLSWNVVQPDVNDDIYFIIRTNDDDNLYIEAVDRLDNDVLTNGTMEADANWSNYNTPTTNERSETALIDTYSRHVVGDAADDGITQTGLKLDRVEDDCTTAHTYGWSNNRYTAIGFIKVVSGTVYMEVIDGDGSTSIKDVQIGTTDGGVWEDFEVTAIDTAWAGGTSDCGDGDIHFYCSGGACEFYLDDVVLGEYGYDYYNDYVGIDDYNTGTQEYAVYGYWRTEKIDNRWWIIDPLDNVFVMKGINNLDSLTHPTSSDNYDFDGNTLCDNLKTKYSAGSCTGLEINRIDDLLSYGINAAGSIMGVNSKYGLGYSATDAASFGQIAWVDQCRMGNLDQTAEMGEVDAGSYDDWVDAYDADYETYLGYEYGENSDDTFLQDCFAWVSPNDNNVTNSESDTIPYKYPPLTYLANPWYIGIDLDEEGYGSVWGNLGCRFFTTDEAGTTDVDGVNDTKIAMVNWLRAKYTDGGESAFVANIGWEGSDEITHPDNWSGVTGYVDADADAAALANLNTAWGTTYGTWDNVLMGSGDDTYGFTTQSNSCATLGVGGDTELYADMDDLHGNWAKKFFGGLYTQVFSSTGFLKGKKINFGVGYGGGGGTGWSKGSHDGETKYLQVVGWRGWAGNKGSQTISAVSEAPDATELAYQKAHYDESGIPIVSESYWVTADFDTVGRIHNGTVDAVYDTGDGVMRGAYDAQDPADCDIANGASVSWDGGTDTGTMHQMWDATDNPHAQDRFILIEDTPSTLEDNDEITDGVCTITVAGTPVDTALIVDNDANFDTDADNPSALFHASYWMILVNKDAVHPASYYMIQANDWVSETGLIPYKSVAPGSGYINEGEAGILADLDVGDEYILGSNDMNTYVGDLTANIYLLDTQTKRANMYIDNVTNHMNIQADDGTYFNTGWHHWGVWDYGYDRTGSQEIRNFGFFTNEDNAYDGSEATIANGEEVDYGDFITPMTTYLTNIYSDLIQEETAIGVGGCSFNGAKFN